MLLPHEYQVVYQILHLEEIFCTVSFTIPSTSQFFRYALSSCLPSVCWWLCFLYSSLSMCGFFVWALRSHPYKGNAIYKSSYYYVFYICGFASSRYVLEHITRGYEAQLSIVPLAVQKSLYSRDAVAIICTLFTQPIDGLFGSRPFWWNFPNSTTILSDLCSIFPGISTISTK